MKTSGAGMCFGLFIALGLLSSNKSLAQLKSSFTSNVQSGCAPLVIAFEDQSTGNPTGWTWYLGNGTVANNQNPTTTYADAGTYTVKLVVKSASGKDSITKTNYITVYSNPTVNFDASPLEGCYPLKVNFINSSKAGSGTISEYLWDLGDGNTDSAKNVTHTYVSAGIYDITLKVTNSYGCYTALTKSDLVQIQNGANAAFNLKSFNVCSTPATAVFNNNSTGSGTLTYFWNFGDGATSTDASPTHNYNSSGDYNVLLTVNSSAGCSDTASLKVSANLPLSSFKYDGATCLNQSIQFTNTSNPAPVSNTWYFGDGTVSTSFNPDNVYDKTGTYTVKLINKFSSSCIDSVTQVIDIATSPTADFSADDTSDCSTPAVVNFTNKTTGTASGYLWDFGDGGTSTDANPSHTYNSQGVYTVSLTAYNPNGCKSVLTKTGYINLQPLKVLRINGLPDSGCAPLAILPEAVLNKGTGNTFNWDFGDGTTSTAEMPKHVYTKEGAFNVKVSVTTEGGCSTEFILPNAVIIGHKPKANFVADKDSICVNTLERFTNTSTNGPITSLRWDYGPFLDPVLGEHYTRNPKDTGYRATILIVYNNGCADTLRKDSVDYVLPPVARIQFKMHCDDKEQVDFMDNSTGGVGYLWNFGDGQTSTTKDITHVYAVPGLYNVNLRVTNKSCYDSSNASVLVIDEKAKISLDTITYCNGSTVTPFIAGANNNNIKNVTWNFGDGNFFTNTTSLSQSHVYAATGKYKLTAKMIDKNACEYDYALPDSVNIYGPSAFFLSPITGVCLGSTVSFSDKSVTDSIHNIVKWLWNFGDTIQEYNSPASFTHLYKDTGDYSVRLKITDSYGCSDSVRRSNYITVSKPYAIYSIEDSIACPGKKIDFVNTSVGRSVTYYWNFGDGGTSTQESPSYTYKGSGVFKPELIATDINGCKDSTQSASLTVAQTVAKFLVNDSVSTCPPLQVNFTNNSTDYKNSTWDFGDGSPSIINSPTHIYTYPGIYKAKLIVNGYGVCADSAEKNIVIKGPTGNINYNTSPICYPDSTKFSSVATNTVLYTWDFSDGFTISTKNNRIAHVYEAGKYLPKVILQDAAGCKVPVKGIDTVVIYDVKANASTNVSAVCDSTPVQFTDSSISADNIIHHYWVFDDGSFADNSSVTHIYKNPGTYSVKLIAQTQTGCRDTFNFASPIAVLTVPQISITGDTAICAAAAANFNGQSVIADSTIRWNWNLNNGQTAYGEQTSSVYNKPGNYTITLSAINAGGCSDTATKNLTVHALPKVIADNDTSICKSGTYQLKASGAVTYTWSGIGLSCTNCPSPTINPTDASTYYVKGKDAIGCAGTDSIKIGIIAPAKITVSNNDTLCAGATVQLHASGAETYKWLPAIYLNSYNSDAPVYTAVKDTSITYKVIGYTKQNCFADTGYIAIKSYPKPELNIPKSEIVLSVGSSVQLNAIASPDITQITWQPPQGLSNAAIANPVASPRQTTVYSVVGSNGGNCVARDEITVRVICGSANVYIPNTFSPNNDGMNDNFYPRGNGLFKIKSFRIFNRWGQLVYERYNATPNNAANGWNGTINGKQVAPDVYIYVIEVLCENNLVIPFKGNITLIR